MVRGKQLKNFDQQDFYINDKKHVPIFIGKRECDKNEKNVVIRELRPVLGVLDKDSPEGKANGGNYFYRLGNKLILQEPIVKKPTDKKQGLRTCYVQAPGVPPFKT